MAAVADVARQLARPSGRAAWRADLALLPRALRWALPWAIGGRVSGHASPCRWLERYARNRPDDLALSDHSARLSFAELYRTCRAVAVTLQQQGVGRGQRVAILLDTNHLLVIALFGCWWLGAVPCPLDPDAPASLTTRTLEHLRPDYWVVQSSRGSSPGVDKGRQIVLDPLFNSPEARSSDFPPVRRLRARDLAMILPTSGTEGSVKLCRVTAGRLALSGHAFGGLALQCRRGDVVFCPLPLCHATAVTVALMPALVHGVALHLSGKFSASQLAHQLRSSGATQLVYVGDLLRYAVNALRADGVPHRTLATHGLRVAVGNGLDSVTWTRVSVALGIPKIVEFYGATEAPSALLNFAGKVGSIGRVPMRRLSRYVLVRQSATGDSSSAWQPCEHNETGELWIRLPSGKRPWLGDFEGYLESRDSQRAMVENVFCPGDRYFRTFDLMRFDEDDYFHYVDRLGDVWRVKGHNVSARWLGEELLQVDGIADACVIPVALDDTSRRFGFAMVVLRDGAEIRSIEAPIRALPSYARPQLIQVVDQVPRGATFKVGKAAWRGRRWKPLPDAGDCYVWADGLVRVDDEIWARQLAELLAS